jgi:predicted DNA-binding protein with PD1-like motif
VTTGVYRSEKSRNLVLRLSAGESVPEAIRDALRDEQVACGWLRGSGVLTDVDLRVYHSGFGTLGDARRIEGTVQALAIEGSIGLSDGDLSLSLRGLLARETDSGVETLCGEIGLARAVALEVFVTALDDVALPRSLDEAAGVWLLGSVSAQGAARQVPARPAAPTAWSGALDASQRSEREPRPRAPAPSPVHAATAIPLRPPKPEARPEVDVPAPEPGDSVVHFAFGDCDVLKSDGDRLHLRVLKGGRICEIALAMLRVSRLADADDGRRRFKLERRMST